MKKGIMRLSENIIPTNYAIKIEPSTDMTSYLCSLAIKATLTKPMKNITLHSKDHKINSATICSGTKCLLPKLKIEESSETIILENQKPISKGEIEIHIEFTGKVTDDLSGIYRSKYEYQGKTNYLITTQCEAPYARRIFPCFDEPAKKATFDISVLIEKNLKAVSNMLPKSESIEGNKKKVEFKTTPKMSTYLFYLGIGDFEFKEDKYNSVKIRVVTTPTKTKNARFALEHAKKYLKYFEDYSEVAYPLEKLDLIAIPDFTVSGMENWGAITFRELVLLVDEEKTSIARRKIAAEVISHELWHQWSGDLVTMEWWNDLWLNESFANYMAFKAVHHYNPEWNIWNDYLSGDLAVGLFKDSLKTTHPIEVHVKSPEEIGEIFDEISYQKGGSILRMLDNYMGEESFRKGISIYLKKYSYANAKATDLWDCLSQVSNDKRVKEMMKSWISEEGYPLVSIEKVQSGLKISQKRYNKSTSQTWPIPVLIKGEKDIYNNFISKKEEIYKIDEDKIKANHEEYGFYRVKYSEVLLNNLGWLVKEKSLSDQDRWGVNSDLWALCNIGEESLENYLRFLGNYQNETTYITLADISGSLRKLERLFYFETWWPRVKGKIMQIILPTFKKELARLGWENRSKDTADDKLIRSLAISFCGYFAEDQEVIKNAYNLYVKDKFSLDIANSIYSIVAKNGNEAAFEDMSKRYEESKDPELKIKLLSGLYYFSKPEILEKALDFALTEKVRSQDLLYVFRNVATNPTNQKIILKWAKKSWKQLKRYEDNHYIMRDIIDTLIISQVKPTAKKEVKSFLDKNKVAYGMTKANAFEILDTNLKFIERNSKFLENY